MNEYSSHLIVQSTESDTNKKLKPFSVLCITQEAAGNHANLLGFGYDNFIINNHAWVLSRIRIKFVDYPKWRDELEIRSWHKGSKMLFSFRDYEICLNGKIAIVGTSSWLIIDTNTRRILRPETVLSEDTSKPQIEKHAIKEACDKLIPPADMEFCRTKEVLFSDLDMMLHTNNAKYLEWALDCIDPNILLNNNISEFQINFNQETRLGEKIDLYIKTLSEKEYFIEGRKDGKNIFQLLIIL